MSDRPIQNCGQLFAFRCPKQWDALRETPDAGVRACDHCQKPVYLCQSEPEVFQHTLRGDCIAVPARMRPPPPLREDPEPKGLEPVEVLAARYGAPVIHLSGVKLDPDVLRLVPPEVAEKHLVIPLVLKGHTLIVAMRDPSRTESLDDLRFLTGYQIEARVASWRDIQDALKRWPPEAVRMELGIPDMDFFIEPSTPIERLLHYVLTNAHREAAEQIHIEATDSQLVIRHLVTGTLHEVLRPPTKLQADLLRHLQQYSGASTERPGLLEYRSREFRAHCQVHLHPLERGLEVVLVMSDVEVR